MKSVYLPVAVKFDIRKLLHALFISLLIGAVFLSALAGLAAGRRPNLGMALIMIMVAILLARSVDRTILFIAFYFPFEETILRFLPVSENIYSALRYAGELLIYWIFLVVLVQKLWKRSFHGTPLDIPLALFAGVTALSALANNSPMIETALFLRGLLRYVFLYYAVSNLDLESAFVKKLVIGLIIVGLIQVAVGSAQLVIGEPLNELLKPHPSTLAVGGHQKEFIVLGLREPGSVWGTTGDTISLALFLMVVLSLATSLAFFSTGYRKLLLVLGCAVFALGTVYTYSRGTILAMLFLLAVAFFIRRKWLIFIVIGVLAILFFTVSPAQEIVPANLENQRTARSSPISDFLHAFSPEYERAAAKKGRLQILKVAPAEVLAKSPLLGIGPTVATEQRFRLLKDVYWVHILYKIGGLGLAAFIWIHLRLMLTARRTYLKHKDKTMKALAFGYLILVAGTILNNFFSSASEVRMLSLYFWLLAGFLVNQALATPTIQVEAGGDLGKKPVSRRRKAPSRPALS